MNAIRSLRARLADAAASGIEAVTLAGASAEELARSDVLKAAMEAASEAAGCAEDLANKAIAQQNSRLFGLIETVESLKINPTLDGILALAEDIDSTPDAIGKTRELCIQAAAAYISLRRAHDAFTQDALSRLWKGYHEAHALEQSYAADIKRIRKRAAKRGLTNPATPARDAAIQDCRRAKAEIKGRIDALDAVVKHFHEMSKEDVDSWHACDAAGAAQLAWVSEKMAPFALKISAIFA